MSDQQIGFAFIDGDFREQVSLISLQWYGTGCSATLGVGPGMSGDRRTWGSVVQLALQESVRPVHNPEHGFSYSTQLPASGLLHPSAG